MSDRKVRKLKVKQTYALSENMKRIQLTGDDLADFPMGCEGGYIKLLFPQACETQIGDGSKPRMRSYTVRAFDKTQLTLDLDFVAHGDNGPASTWALSARVGDEISMIGPGVVKLPDMTSDWFFLVGDMTALPALSVIVEGLPKTAKGYLVVELLSDQDKPQLDLPKGMQLEYVINPNQETPSSLLADKVMSLPWFGEGGFVWSACEMSSMKQLRHYFLKEKMLSRDLIYISSYWKMGVSDEGHKLAKKEDAQNT